MTTVIEDRILKEANGNISDHLRNHIHLTNCIHLKNHMHKQSPAWADRSLMRDLIVLQKSRSLRDPSASPPSWQSPQIVDLLPKKGDRDTTVQEGRSSVGIEPGRKGRKLSGCSPPLGINATSKVAPSEVGSKGETMDSRRILREESTHRSNSNVVVGVYVESLPDQCVSHMGHEVVSGNSEPKGKRSKQKGKHVQEVQEKTLSEQLKKVPMDSDGLSSCNVGQRGRHSRPEKIIDEPETSMRSHDNGSNRTKRRKFRGARRHRVSSTSRDIGTQNELSVDSNSLAPGTSCPKCYMEEEKEEHGKKNVSRGPGNRCGIPWNWSRIHDRGKNFLDLAGRSFACGSSDNRLRNDGLVPHVRETYDIPITSDQSNSHAKFDGDALPLLVEASGSHESCDNNGWVRDYSGELGIFADNLFEHDCEFDVDSEVRSSNQRKLSRHHIRHQSLTQKYMPKTFRDLVGQNLVAQALSNAVSKKKIGLLYVFYGPHGTGKTSCARIFARALNCQSLEPPKPCGFCNACIAYDKGKCRAIREVGPVSDVDLESITELLDNMNVSHLPLQYRVFIFDDCDSLPANCWSSISKVIDRAHRRIVIVLVCSSLDVLPHIVISRCQKFFFPKLKDADIIYTLQWIATKEDLEIDKDALKLIASRSDGSLRDAEMTLEQLGLLGERISVPLVQELVGLISDEKLVELLDLALSADTVNTVKNLRTIMETGVEPLALMSQLATVITDILAGSYNLTKERPRRKFFQRQPLSKDDMEKLRQALRILSETEKQLRMSSDKLTWLTAALLQLAPDQQYLPSISAEASSNHSPLALNNVNGLDLRKSSEKAELAGNSKKGSHPRQSNLYDDGMKKSVSVERKRQVADVLVPRQTSTLSSESTRIGSKHIYSKSHLQIEEIWLDVLQQIPISGTKEFLSQEGNLISVTFGAGPTVQLMFSSHLAKSMAERCRGQILQAFEAVLRSPVTIEIRCESKDPTPLILSASKNSLSHGKLTNKIAPQSQFLHPVQEIGRSEIVEVAASPAGKNSYNLSHNHAGEAASSSKLCSVPSIQERNTFGNLSHSQSMVRGKVSLAHVIQQAEGYSQRTRWSKRKAFSIAEKLEQENLRLEPQSRSLICWKACRATRRKLSRLKIRKQKPRPLLKLICCGKCLFVNSPSLPPQILEFFCELHPVSNLQFVAHNTISGA